MKYEVTITSIGNLANTFLQNNKSLIILNQKTFPNLSDMVIEHTEGNINGEISVGDTLTIGIQSYEITGIGEKAIVNLHEDGHCTIVFNKEIELPGQIAVSGDAAPRLSLGDRISIE